MVRSASGLLIGVRTWHVIRELARTLEHLALVIGPVGVLDLFCQCLNLIHGMRHTNQVTPSDAVKGVARSADLLIHEVTSPNARTGSSMRVRKISGIDGVRYPAWSNESNHPLCDHGYAAG